MLDGREVTLFNRIVRFIIVDSINSNVCFLNTMQRLVRGKDQLVTFSMIAPGEDLIWFGTGEVRKIFTRVDMHHRSICNVLSKLGRQLTSKHEARSNHYNGFIAKKELAYSIHDSNQGLTTASGNHYHTLEDTLHDGKCFGLVGTKLHGCHNDRNIIQQNLPPIGELVVSYRIGLK